MTEQSNPTMAQTVQAKKDLELAIRELLTQFTAQHLLRVDSIDVSPVSTYGGNGAIDYFVEVEARL